MDLRNVFLTIWNMSLTGSIIILFVLLARLCLRKSPKVFSYMLWAVVLFRLLCPVSVSSVFSVLNFTKAAAPVSRTPVSTMDYSVVQIPDVIPAAENETETDRPVLAEPEAEELFVEIPVIPDDGMEHMEEPDAVTPQAPAEPEFDLVHYAVIIWIVGLGAMLIYNVFSFLRLFRQIGGAVPLRKELYLADYIPTAFVLGVIKPRIYLPSYLTAEEQGYIIAHERCHIKRKDHVFRLLAYLALCLHWFNPLVWLAFVLSGKDMEMSCDEAVIRMYGPRIRAEYAQSLLRLATGHRSFALTPLAFGEGDTKERVINMSKWKKPKLWASIIALAVCVAVLVACAVNPTGKEDSTEGTYFDRSKDVDQICIDAIDALMDAESYHIVYEKQLTGYSETTDYFLHESDQLVMSFDNEDNNRVYFGGKLGLFQYGSWIGTEAWVWQGEESNYDPNAWLREWSPEYLETGGTHMGEDSITLKVTWPHPYNEARHYKGSITYTFNPDGSLKSASREAVLMEGDSMISGLIDSITPQDCDPDTIRAGIRDTAIMCVDGEEWKAQDAAIMPSMTLPERTSIGARTVDEFLAAIGPNTSISLEGGSYNLCKASNYGQDTGSDYYYWRKVSDGYELVIRGVSNLVISGAGIHVTTIETEPRYADVIKMEKCNDVFLHDFTAGHTRDMGTCGGDVIELNSCRNYEMSNLGLFGCGTVGLYTVESSNILLSACDIYECSSSAVQLEHSDGVTLSDCDIYRIASDSAASHTVFYVTQCSEVLINSCRINDNTSRYLLSSGTSGLTMQNCLIKDNRFEEAALLVQGWDIKMSQNHLRNNSIRNWFSLSNASVIDANGNKLTEEVLEEMYGTLGQKAAQNQLEIRVSTVDELIAAIGPNKKIVMEPGTYNLRTASGYGRDSGDYYFWRDTGVDGFELVIRNVDNMTIQSGGDRGELLLVTEPRYANVLAFRACSNIMVSAITAGHTEGQGACTGGVLRFEDSDHLLVENCGLFGCGTMGVEAEDCGNITVRSSEIYECSESGVKMRNTNIIRLEDTTFRDIGGNYIVWLIGCKDARWDGEVLIEENSFGDVRYADPEQQGRNTLEYTLMDFVYYYFYDKQEEMRKYLASSYDGPGLTHNTGKSNNKSMHFEVTFDHVDIIDREGSYTFEIPYHPYEIDDERWDEVRYLLVTVVKEDGVYKIGNYKLQE